MITLYSLTIFISLAFIAIVIALFVFASSIYRGALELSTKQEEEALNRRKELISRKRKELIEKIGDIDEERFPKELRAELNKLDAELNNIDQSIVKSRNKAKALTVRNIIGVPISLLLISIIASGIAIATSGILPMIMWILSLILIAISLYFIFRNLFIIESFSRIIDLGTLMEQALERHTMKMRPIVDIRFWPWQLEVKHGETQEIKYILFLEQGLTAKNVRVRFAATEKLDFPEEDCELFRFNKLTKDMINPKFFWHKLGAINYNVYREEGFKVKAPNRRGEYTMSHWIQCDEFTSEEQTFLIKVT